MARIVGAQPYAIGPTNNRGRGVAKSIILKDKDDPLKTTHIIQEGICKGMVLTITLESVEEEEKREQALRALDFAFGRRYYRIPEPKKKKARENDDKKGGTDEAMA